MIKIITDTSSDITLSQAKQMNLEILPLTVSFGDTPYYQLEDETFEKFYEMHEKAEVLPLTAQVAPSQYAQHFEEAKKNNEHVIVITISSVLSGTMQSALLAKEIVDYDKIHIVDSRTATIGQRLLVELSVRLRDAGTSVDEIVKKVTEVTNRVHLVAVVDTLKYLVKGGRLSKSAGMIGSVLNMKPLVCVKDGAVVAAGKARGSNKAIELMLDYIDNKGNVDPAFPFCFGYTKAKGQLDSFIPLAKEKFNLNNIKTYPIGGVIGTHAGPFAFAAVWIAEK
jgi:DegV family protein with EDD domain